MGETIKEDMVELKIGRKSYNEIVEYFLTIVNMATYFNDENAGIRCKIEEVDRFKSMEEGELRDTTYFNFEMTYEYLSHIHYMRDEAIKIATNIVKRSFKKYKAERSIEDLTIGGE